MIMFSEQLHEFRRDNSLCEKLNANSCFKQNRHRFIGLVKYFGNRLKRVTGRAKIYCLWFFSFSDKLLLELIGGIVKKYDFAVAGVLRIALRITVNAIMKAARRYIDGRNF